MAQNLNSKMEANGFGNKIKRGLGMDEIDKLKQDIIDIANVYEQKICKLEEEIETLRLSSKVMALNNLELGEENKKLRETLDEYKIEI